MKNTLVALSLILAAGAVEAQKARPIDVKVVQVNDRRTKGHFSRLTLAVELPSVKLGEVQASRVLLTKAVDDSGADLKIPSEDEPQLQTNSSLMYLEGDALKKPASVSIEMNNPARDATKVAEVRGEIELFMPARDPNSVATIAKFMNQSGKALSHKALKANGVEITMVSAAQIEAEKKKGAAAKRKEAEAEGYGAEYVETMVNSFMEMFFAPQENDVVLRIKDPKKRIESITYVDAKGAVKPVMMNEEEGFTVLSTWSEKPAADWGLRVNMKTAKNLVRYPFVIADVALP
jgi:hypothetical protein